MSIRLTTDLNDPQAATTTFEMKDVLNPLINPLWNTGARNNNELSTRQVYNLLKSLYTRQNVLENLSYFFPMQTRPESLEIMSKIIQDLPEEYLWLFEWLQVKKTEQDYVAIYHWDLRAEYNSSNVFYPHLGEYALIKTLGSSTDYPGFIERLTDKISRINTMMGELFLRHSDLPFKPDYGWTATKNAEYFHWFASNSPCITYLNTSARPSRMEEIRARPGAEFIYTYAANHYGELERRLVCKVKVTKENKAPLHTVFEHSFNVLDILSKSLQLSQETKPVLYGVELELTTDYSAKDLIEATDEPFFCCKKDGSITGSKKNKYELVTSPTSLKMHKLQWSHWFKNLDVSHFDTSLKTTNGMHAHISKDAFGKDDDYNRHLKNFCWLITNPINQMLTLDMSERGTLQAMEQYAKMPDLSKYRKIQAYHSNLRTLQSNRGAINLGSNKGTIEVRLFRGVVSFSSIIKNLEFVDSILNFTRDISFQNNTLHNYLTWVEKQPANRYQILRAAFAALKINQHLESATLQDIIFNEKDPHTIIKLLEKSRIHHSNKHVTLLNHKIGKRTFIYDKKTQRIVLVPESQGMLVSHDNQMVNKYTMNHEKRQKILPSESIPATSAPEPWPRPVQAAPQAWSASTDHAQSLSSPHLYFRARAN